MGPYWPWPTRRCSVEPAVAARAAQRVALLRGLGTAVSRSSSPGRNTASRRPDGTRSHRQGALHAMQQMLPRSTRPGQSRTTTTSPVPGTSAVCRSSSPTSTRRPRRARWHPPRPSAGPGRVRHDRRRGAPGRLLPAVAGLRAAGWLDATITVGQSFGGTTRRWNDAHGSPGRPPRRRRRRRGRRAGAGERRHRHAVGLLGCRVRRRAARRPRPRGPRSGVPAGLGVGPAGQRHRGISHHSARRTDGPCSTPADVPVARLPDPATKASVRSQLGGASRPPPGPR